MRGKVQLMYHRLTMCNLPSWVPVEYNLRGYLPSWLLRKPANLEVLKMLWGMLDLLIHVGFLYVLPCKPVPLQHQMCDCLPFPLLRQSTYQYLRTVLVSLRTLCQRIYNMHFLCGWLLTQQHLLTLVSSLLL